MLPRLKNRLKVFAVGPDLPALEQANDVAKEIEVIAAFTRWLKQAERAEIAVITDGRFTIKQSAKEYVLRYFGLDEVAMEKERQALLAWQGWISNNVWLHMWAKELWRRRKKWSWKYAGITILSKPIPGITFTYFDDVVHLCIKPARSDESRPVFSLVMQRIYPSIDRYLAARSTSTFNARLFALEQ